MARPTYGEIYDQKFIKQVGDYELWVSKVQWLAPSVKHIFILFVYGGDGFRDDALTFDTEEEAIARGTEKALELTQRNQESYEKHLGDRNG